MSSNGDIYASRYLGTNGLSPTSGYPTGWTYKGIHTGDVYSDGGSIGAGSGGSLQAYINRDGQGYLSSWFRVGGKVIANNDIEMTNGNFLLNEGGAWIKKGNLDVSQGGGSGNGSAWFQDTVTIGKDSDGNYGDHQGTGTFNGGDLNVYGNIAPGFFEIQGFR